MSDTIECMICLSVCPIAMKCNGGSGGKCKERVCSECMGTYIKHSLQEKRVLRCAAEKCNGYYVRSTIAKFPKLLPEYDRCILEGLFNEQHMEISKKVEQDQIIA